MRGFAQGVALAVAMLIGPVVAGAAERMIVVPMDEKPFAVRPNEFVRLAAEAMSGAEITATIHGPAKIVAENVISSRVDGQQPIGAFTREFEIKPTGRGTVKVTITVTFPIPDEKPRKTSYRFEVK